ncbi:MAG: flagellar biosynthesis/type III secretory pathway protein, partial [Hydrogenobaculum sp.]
PFTIEELKDLPFIAKAIEQLEQEAILKGKKEGLQEGLEKGKQEGLREGLEKGKQEGLREGVTKAKRDYVKSAILMKFGVLPKELEEKIENTDDTEVLDEMFKKVMLANKIEEIS